MGEIDELEGDRRELKRVRVKGDEWTREIERGLD